MVNNSSLNRLLSLSQKLSPCIKTAGQPSSEKLFLIEFIIADKSWSIYIEDEYGDFNEENQLLSFFLTLRSLEDFAESDDYLSWCKQYHLNASNVEWLNYYQGLSKEYHEIEGVLGSINSFINPMDYQLRSGAYYELLKNS